MDGLDEDSLETCSDNPILGVEDITIQGFCVDCTPSVKVLTGAIPIDLMTFILAGRKAEEGIDGLIAEVGKGITFSPDRKGGGGSRAGTSLPPGIGL